MAKTVAVFRSSPRPKGNTNSLTDVVVSRLRESGCIINDHDLSKMNIAPCTACRECQKDWSEVSCVIKDDFSQIISSVSSCDLVILATPIYSWYCTPPMKAMLDRMVYAFNMYYGEKRGPALWEGKAIAVISTCGYPPEKGADLFLEGIRRYCKHSRLRFVGSLVEHHEGYDKAFMDEQKTARAEQFADALITV